MYRQLFIAPLLLSLLSPSNAQDKYESARIELVEELRKEGIKDSCVLAAMKSVARHLFVPENLRSSAYDNIPLPIGEGQTISQPYVVALMTQELKLGKNDKVLEIGTGSGYQAAILAEIADSVFTVEIKSKLAANSADLLKKLGYQNIQCQCADGYYGWTEHAPFDAIMITCAVNHVPPPLLQQLKIGGRLILPLGSTRFYQTLTLLTKTEKQVEAEYLGTVAFVPMTGAAEKR
ncbi:MAG: protein-L-isoaspartate(D-aspartate) O-methyltransferase [candidate division KSB1 bacterium]|nr:protein-L-isoaspartate(D-aspartate) O-methyltransferase [candidate division KSB1 bacterium]MDZ7302838.1 protein-L-isoaspartate(D-aspartate) O-methyltransferase [candidate division KSB1 bacterium]MDZ7311855.1 protein-L-isoaspartate(D-aspartate) O-methyltransferase [candidate division KSB1 bacterium]